MLKILKGKNIPANKFRSEKSKIPFEPTIYSNIPINEYWKQSEILRTIFIKYDNLLVYIILFHYSVARFGRLTASALRILCPFFAAF
jgi:hypothetical protein